MAGKARLLHLPTRPLGRCAYRFCFIVLRLSELRRDTRGRLRHRSIRLAQSSFPSLRSTGQHAKKMEHNVAGSTTYDAIASKLRASMCWRKTNNGNGNARWHHLWERMRNLDVARRLFRRNVGRDILPSPWHHVSRKYTVWPR
jgi:hypothetical protein